MDQEDKRQVFHICIGLAAVAFLLFFGREITIAAVFCTLIFGTVLMNARLLGIVLPFISWFEENFERKNAPINGWGSACYATGALFALTFLTNVEQIAATVLILGLGDGLSTIVGRRGKMKLVHNKKKTLEGTVAFALASLTAYYFVGVAAVPISIIAALVESSPYFDDNLLIPVACTVFFLVAI